MILVETRKCFLPKKRLESVFFLHIFRGLDYRRIFLFQCVFEHKACKKVVGV